MNSIERIIIKESSGKEVDFGYPNDDEIIESCKLLLDNLRRHNES